MPRVIITNKAMKQLKKLKKEQQQLFQQIKEFIEKLEKGYFPKGYDIEKLKVPKKIYRVKLGDYRLFYKIDFVEKMSKIFAIVHRKKAYK